MIESMDINFNILVIMINFKYSMFNAIREVLSKPTIIEAVII